MSNMLLRSSRQCFGGRKLCELCPCIEKLPLGEWKVSLENRVNIEWRISLHESLSMLERKETVADYSTHQIKKLENTATEGGSYIANHLLSSDGAK